MSATTAAAVHTAALRAAAAGMCVLPVRADGTKAPDVRTWTRYQAEPPDAAQLDQWFAPGRHGLGVVCGAVSGGLEMLELEGRAVDEGVHDELLELAEHEGLLDLVDRIADGYTERTPTGGIHWLYRCAEVAGNTKLAERAATADELAVEPHARTKTLIETRGEGGFVVVAPSNGKTHPTGQPWVVEIGDLDTVTTISAAERRALWRVCRMLDRTPPPPTVTPSPRPTPRSADDGERPGDAYNASTTWDQVLGDHGWARVYDRGPVQHWRRPGKTAGVSATVNANGTDRLVVHSTSTPFQPSPQSYDRFGAYALLEHAGDLAAAARHLRSLNPPTLSSRPPAPRGGGGDDPPAGGDQADSEERPAGRPMVVVNNRPLDHISGDITDRLVTANDPPVVYVRGGHLARVRLDEKGRPLVEQLQVAELRHRVARVVDTVRTLKDGGISHIATPLDVVADILADTHPPFPPLEAVVETPTVRPDGHIHQDVGYDPTSRLLHIPAPGFTVPPVADQPTGEQLAAAVELVGDLLCDFPFDSPADRANAVGLLLTPLVRPAIAGQVPLAAIDSPEPGTGKGLLANVTAVIHTGRPAAARPLAREDDEIRKAIMSILLEGPTFVVLDNVEDAVRSPALAALLTTDTWSDRILGSSSQMAVANRATWVATGNNIAVGGDLARRCYRIRLDAHTARPYTRTGFRHTDLLGWATQHRGQLLNALLTMCRAWWAAGQPAPAAPAVLGGFTPWAQTIAGILDHAGIPGFLDNLEAFRSTADLEADTWEAFLDAVLAIWHDKPFTTADIAVEVDAPMSRLMPVLPPEVADHVGRPGFAKRLGEAFRKRAGRRHGDQELAVERAGKTRNKTVVWTVTTHTAGDAGTAGTAVPASDDDRAGTAGTSTDSDGSETAESAGTAGSAGSDSPHAHTRAHAHAYTPAPTPPLAWGGEVPAVPAVPAGQDDELEPF